MRIFKLISGGLVLLITGLFIHQNLATFNSSVTFTLDLFIKEKVTGQFSLYSLLLVAGLTGAVVGVFLILKPYFNVRRLLAQERQRAQAPLDTPTPTEPVQSEIASQEADKSKRQSEEKP